MLFFASLEVILYFLKVLFDPHFVIKSGKDPDYPMISESGSHARVIAALFFFVFDYIGFDQEKG